MQDANRAARAERVGWYRLWTAVAGERECPAVELWSLGEYAALLRMHGPWAAAEHFPAIAAHLARPCQPCTAELEAMRELLLDEA